MASHGNVLVIQSDEQFNAEFQQNSNKLVIVDFTASWCGPCKRIAPVFEQLSTQFTQAVFLKVDVDICKGTAAIYGIRAMPTFLFFLHGQKLDELRGPDPKALEEKILQLSLQSNQTAVDSSKVTIGRALDCFRELLENSPDAFDSASQLLLRIANNVIKEPKEIKYRTLKLSTNTFQNKLLPVKGAVECLFAMGFEDNDDKVVLDEKKSLDDLTIIRDTILDERNKREVMLQTLKKY
ncbi:monothiol glutaredoxin-S11-like [Xenia sp. Carnegie-2017]|uniref:monothiol glutaredoxin-S11-like n=1 Tax=Xenia sp. Carnegie-2017 TaxID=2897299 RepID=UPI001F046958|nr:monothiol glutaredoxin-S11-like [Xenia sp. Carnegie-2017]